MTVMDLLNPTFLIFLGISVLLIALLTLYFESKLREQNHKITSMLSLVSTLADEINYSKNGLNNLTMMIGGKPINKPNNDSDYVIKKQQLINVSDDEDADDEANDDDDDDDDDDHDDDDDENDDDDDENDDDDNDENDDDDDENDDDDDYNDNDDNDEDNKAEMIKIRNVLSNINNSNENKDDDVYLEEIEDLKVFKIDDNEKYKQDDQKESDNLHKFNKTVILENMNSLQELEEDINDNDFENLD